MNDMRITILLTVLLNIAACSLSGGSGDNGDLPDDPVGTDSPIGPLAFSGNVLVTESRLVSYSNKAGRISIVDPIQEKEIWGKNIAGYDFAVAHPDFQGATLFKQDAVLVVVNSEDRLFDLGQAYHHTSVAQDRVAYSMAAEDGRSFEVIRALENGQWQQAVFTVPWSDTLDAAVTSSPEGQPVLLVTKFSDDGNTLIVFSPSDGRYAVFTTNPDSGLLTAGTDWCAGDGAGIVANASFRSLAWDESRGLLFLGDKNGRVYALDPFAACLPMADLPAIDLPGAAASHRISIYESGQLAVTQEGGTLTIINYGTDGFDVDKTTYENVCAHPMSSMKLSELYLLVMCLGFDNDLDDKNASPDNANLDPTLYITLDTSTGLPIHTYSTYYQLSAGIAIEPQGFQLYRMIEGGFGRLEIVNLVTGEQRSNIGLFIQDILQD